jgi:hypothetical protein
VSESARTNRIKGECPACEQHVWLIDAKFEDHDLYGRTPAKLCIGSSKTFDEANEAKGRPDWAWQ